MTCRITDMHDKEVINLANGSRLGNVDDVVLDTTTALLTAIIIYGKQKLFGIRGHEDDLVIPWENIEVIGEDTILVHYDFIPAPPSAKRKNSISNALGL